MADSKKETGVYGLPPLELVPVPADAVQFSPMIPGAATLEDQPGATLTGMTVLAPPGTLERRYTLALALRGLATGAPLVALALKDKGGARIEGELAAFGCAIEVTGKRHYRICSTKRPKVLTGIEAAIADGAPRRIDALGLWSQPGVFSWDRIDSASALLIQHLPVLTGRGADFGCGIGVLSRAVLSSPSVTNLILTDSDRRAIDVARRNIDDPRADFLWADVERAGIQPASLDFVVMNPPFHDGGAEDKALGQGFIRRAAAVLRPAGRLWLVANRHLPYEAVMKQLYKRVTPKIEAGRYKIYEAQT